MITILARSRLSETKATPKCKCCNAPLAFALSSYLITLRIQLPDNPAPKGGTFTVHVCTTCARRDDTGLIRGLRNWAETHYDDLFAPMYMAYMRDEETT